MPSSQPDKDWFMLIELDSRNLLGYVDMVMWDDEMEMIPLPDRKHWLEPIAVMHDKKEVQVQMWKYTEDEKNVERVTVCCQCGMLVSAACSKQHKLCPDCETFRNIANDT